MTAVRLGISRESIVVRVPAKDFSFTVANEIKLRDRTIEGVGGAGISAAEAASQSDLVTGAAFDASNFDPVLAEAMTRWAVSEGLKRSRIGWRHKFALPALDIDWPAWGSIPAHRRYVFLESYRQFRVTVNGRPAIRPRVDVPLLRGLFGTRIDPRA